MSGNPLKLDEEELQILGDFERGEFESIQHFRAEKRSLEAAAKRTLQKDKRINIRMSSRDLEKLRAALRERPCVEVANGHSEVQRALVDGERRFLGRF